MRSRSVVCAAGIMAVVLMGLLVTGAALADPVTKATFSIEQEHVFQRMPLAVNLHNQQQIKEFEVKFKFTEVGTGRGVLPSGSKTFLPPGWQGMIAAGTDGSYEIKCWWVPGASKKIESGKGLIAQLYFQFYFTNYPVKLKVEMSTTANGKQATAIAPDELVVLPPLPPLPPWPVPLF